MSISSDDYIKLYQVQNKVLEALKDQLPPFYLTGGTALGRFYLGHRYSDDIDLFSNDNKDFKTQVSRFRTTLEKKFEIVPDKIVVADDFVRIWVQEDPLELKTEFVNDLSTHCGNIISCNDIPIDSLENILSNKLTALVSRDEPKDVFDIVQISKHYSFNWSQIFDCCLKKALIAEQDIAIRLEAFPFEWLKAQPWLKSEVDETAFNEVRETLINDFILSKDNSLGKGKLNIKDAVPTRNM